MAGGLGFAGLVATATARMFRYGRENAMRSSLLLARRGQLTAEQRGEQFVVRRTNARLAAWVGHVRRKIDCGEQRGANPR